MDQDVLDLESLKNDAPTEKQGDKLATLEMQLAAASSAANGGQVGQEETPPYGNIEKQQGETDVTVKVDDAHSEMTNSNANGDRAQGAQPKVILFFFVSINLH